MILGEDGRKMSKSFGNVVNPDDVVAEYGADTLRLYEMFMGPLEKTPKPWSTKGVEGVRRFLERVHRLIWNEEGDLSNELTSEESGEDLKKSIHKMIKLVTEGAEEVRLNTAISRMMEFVNELTKLEKRPKDAIEALLQVLNPFAPHLTEEAWQALGHTETLFHAPWPTYDESCLTEDTVEIAVQVNGKIKARVDIAVDMPTKDIETLALDIESVKTAISDKDVKKIVVIPKRMVNVVAK